MKARALLPVVAAAALSACAPLRTKAPAPATRLGPPLSPEAASRLGITAEDQAMSHFLRGEVAFANGDLGTGAAVGWILAIIIFVIGLVQIRISGQARE